MRDFSQFISRGDVRRAKPDPDLAASLLKKASERAEVVLSLRLDAKTAALILEELYETLREVCDALLAAEGFKSYSHEGSIAFLKGKVPTDLVAALDNLRKKRNNSKYYGAKILVEEASGAVAFFDEAFPVLKKLVKKK